MIPPVPYSLRMLLALAFISTAVTIHVSAGIVADLLAAFAHWIVPEHEEQAQ